MTAHSNSIPVRVGAISERGRRPENQDQMNGVSSALGSVYLVADGMGGHQGGAEAAHIVSEGFRHYLLHASAGTRLEDALQQAASAINTEMLRRGTGGDAATRGMGSTVVLIALRRATAGAEFVVGHIGDSRAYLLREGRLRLLTSDHSMVQRLVEEQILTAEAARNHPQSNVLTRAFGQQQEVLLELSPAEPLESNDVLMVCSDGLWGYVKDDEIAVELARTPQMETVASNLVQLALARGSDDNITVQVLRVEELAPANRRAPRPTEALPTATMPMMFPPAGPLATPEPIAPPAPVTTAAPVMQPVRGASSGHLAVWVTGCCVLGLGLGGAGFALLHHHRSGGAGARAPIRTGTPPAWVNTTPSVSGAASRPPSQAPDVPLPGAGSPKQAAPAKPGHAETPPKHPQADTRSAAGDPRTEPPDTAGALPAPPPHEAQSHPLRDAIHRARVNAEQHMPGYNPAQTTPASPQQ